MFKLFILLSLFQASISGFAPGTSAAPRDCPGVTNLQKTGQTASSFTYGWDAAFAGAQYRVWYVRQEGSYFSGYFYTYSPTYQFSGLSAGHYTFYFQTLCEGGTSEYIGLEEVIG